MSIKQLVRQALDLDSILETKEELVVRRTVLTLLQLATEGSGAYKLCPRLQLGQGYQRVVECTNHVSNFHKI